MIDANNTVSFLKAWKQKRGLMSPLSPKGASSDAWQQAEMLFSLGIIHHFGDVARDHLRRETENLHLLRERLPSVDREPFLFWEAVVNKVAIEIGARRIGYHVIPEVLFDTLERASVNAVTLKVDGTEDYIVLIDLGLLLFTSLTATILEDAWRQLPRQLLEFDGVPDYDAVSFAVNKKPGLPLRFGRLLTSALLEEDFLHSTPGIMSDDVVGSNPFIKPVSANDPVAGKLPSAIEVFMLGHEYGHILANHLSGAEAPDSGIKVFKFDAGSAIPVELSDEARTYWNQEVQADAIALDLVFEVARQRGWYFDVAFAGVDLFLSCVDYLEKGVNVIRRGNTDVPANLDHPPTYTRRDCLRKRVRETMDPNVSDMLIRCGELMECLAKIFFHKVTPFLVRAHVAGTPLASSFRPIST